MKARLERAESIRDKAEEMAKLARETADAIEASQDDKERELLRAQFEQFRQAYSSLAELAIETLKK